MQAERTYAYGTGGCDAPRTRSFYTASMRLTKVLYKTIFTGKR